MSMWRHEVKEKLGDYNRQLNATATLPDELRRLELEATGIRAANGNATPVQGGSTISSDAVRLRMRSTSRGWTWRA